MTILQIAHDYSLTGAGIAAGQLHAALGDLADDFVGTDDSKHGQAKSIAYATP